MVIISQDRCRKSSRNCRLDADEGQWHVRAHCGEVGLVQSGAQTAAAGSFGNVEQ